MRQSILGHYGTHELLRLTEAERGFLDKFSRFIHHDNVLAREALEAAYADVAGNVNGKVVFVDLSLKVN